MKAAFALLTGLAFAPTMVQAASAGDCFALVFVPPRYETQTEQVLQIPATEQVRTIPARYEWVEEKIKIPEGKVAVVVTPAEYEWTEERVQVSPAREKQVQIPARYKTVREKIVTKTGPVTKLAQSPAGADSAGAILCTVDQPIEYKWVERKVLVTSARTESVQVPAQFKTVKRKKRLRAEEVRWVMARERFRTRRVKTLVEPAREERVPVPAVYETVTKQVMVAAPSSEWREVLCKSNVTPALVTDVQRRLSEQGHYRGRISGQLTSETQAAIKKYQASVGLPQTGIDLETLKKMGLKS